MEHLVAVDRLKTLTYKTLIWMFFCLNLLQGLNVKQNFYGLMASTWKVEAKQQQQQPISPTAAQVAKRFVSLASRISYDDLKGGHERFWDSHENLVGGFNPLENDSQTGNLPQNRGEHKKYLEPPLRNYIWQPGSQRKFQHSNRPLVNIPQGSNMKRFPKK